MKYIQRKEDRGTDRERELERDYYSSMSNRIQAIVSARAEETGGEIFAFNMCSNLLSPSSPFSHLLPDREVQSCKSPARLLVTLQQTHHSFSAQILEFLKRHVVCLLGRFIKPEQYVIIVMLILKC